MSNSKSCCNILAILSMLMAVAFPLATNADTAIVDGITWAYCVENGAATIGFGSESDAPTAIPVTTVGDITIPSHLGGCLVTSIGSSAFLDCSGLTSVTIPDSVTSIGPKAFADCSGLTSVTMGNGVTSIGNSAFAFCSGLTSVTIPDSVTSIGPSAFEFCRGLTSVTIGNGVTSIGSYAFCHCSGLTSVTIPDSVTSIGSWAFWGCSGLTSVTLGNSVKSIGECAFSGCSGLTSVTIPDSMKSIGESAFIGCSGLTSVTIPDSVTSIWPKAFSGCSGLTSVTIPDSVTSIWDYAFSGCGGLTSVTIGNGVTSIGSKAFEDCCGLKSVTIPDSVKSIGGGAFLNCGGLTSVTIGNGVTSIGNSAFEFCRGLTSVTIPDSVTSIGSHAFYGCSGLTSVTIGNGVTSIGRYAFYNCGGLTSVTIPDSVTSIGSYAFCNCGGLTSVTIGNGVTSIEDDTFCSCSNLASVTIGNGVTSIGYYAFRLCDSLVYFDVHDANPQYKSVNGFLLSSDCKQLLRGINGNVTIPDCVTSIGYQAFGYCSGLKRVTIPDSVKSIWPLAFIGCSGLESVTIPDSVTSIGNGAFKECSGLTSVTIGKGVTSISSEVFKGCNNIYEATLPGHKCGFPMKHVEKLVILAGTTSIEDETFKGCSGLKSVTIPDSVKSIGESAFEDCSGLTSVTIGKGVTSIGNGAFAFCSGLERVCISDLAAWCKIDFEAGGNPLYYAHNFYVNGELVTDLEIPDSVTSIGSFAFEYYTNLKSVTIPDSVTSIGSYAFQGCSGLKSVTIGNGVKSIGGDAFEFCSGLTSVTIPDSVTSMGHGVFEFCSGLTSVTIGNGVTNIREYAFFKCSGLTSVTIPDSVTSIGPKAFADCSGLTSVTIPDSVTSIWEQAFAVCSSLKSVTIPDSVTSIDRWAFSGCSGLTSVTIGNGVTSIGYGMFKGCSGLTSVTIPDSVTRIRDEAFKGCSGLTGVTIGNGVKSIGSEVFEGCNNLHEAILPGHKCGFPMNLVEKLVILAGTTSIEDETFKGCSGLKSVTIPDSVKSIGVSAFEDCGSLKRVFIHSGATKIQGRAFQQCNNLELILFEGNAPTIGVNAFLGIPSDCEVFVAENSSGWGVSIPGVWNGFSIRYYNGSIEALLNYKPYVSGTYSECASAKWDSDYAVNHDGMAALRLEGNGLNSESAVKLTVNGPGRLSFWWKSSSEYDAEIDAVYDYGRVSVDGVNMGGLTSDYKLFGDAIGGDTDWTNTLLDILGKGTHDIVWSYKKDEYDEILGCEDCIWLDQVSWVPLVTVSFDLNGGSGNVPDEIVDYFGIEQSLIPYSYGFWKDGYGFDGWSDGENKYTTSYVLPAEDVVLMAQWIRKSVLTFDINGGVGTAVPTISNIPNETIILPLATNLSKAKHTFAGWDDGETIYAAGASYTVSTSDVTFKAVWVANTISTPVISSPQVSNGGVASDAKSVALSLSSEEGTAIHYTLDGSEPTEQSPLYSGTLQLTDYFAVVKAIAVKDNYFNSDVAEFSFVRKPFTLAECLGLEEGGGITVRTFGDGEPWYRVLDEESHDGVAGLRSGAITHSQTNGVEVVVSGVGTLSFWWKVSSETVRGQVRDGVSFFVDGVQIGTTIGGASVGWEQVVYNVTEQGNHVFKWIYGKSATDTAEIGEDCAWLDDINWVHSAPTFNIVDGVLTSVVPYDYTEIVIPDSVTSIGESAFEDCSGLTSVTISDSVTSIDRCAFRSCSGLESVMLGNGVMSIGWCAFYYCANLKSVTIPDSVTSIGSYAFADCSGLTSVTIPDSVMSIGHDAFSGCSGLISVTIGNGVTSIGYAAFSGCNNVREAMVPGWRCNIPFGNVTNLVISSGTTSIGEDAFAYCSGLTSVTIPDSVTSIGSEAFYRCNGLEWIKVENCELDLSIAGIKSGVDIQRIHDEVETIVARAPTCTKDGWTHEVSCSRCHEIQEASMVIEKLGHIEVETKAAKASTCTEDGWTREVICSRCNKVIESSEVLEGGHIGVETKAAKAPTCAEDGWTHEVTCGRCNEVLEMSLPIAALGHDMGEGVVTKEPTIFDEGVMSYYCTRCGSVLKTEEITKLVIEWEIDAAGVLTSVNLNGATEIVIPDGVTGIGNDAFRGCSSLTCVTMPDSVAIIGDSAFRCCSNLVEVALSAGLTDIGEYAFRECVSLESVTIPDSVESIGKKAFELCGNLTNIDIGSGVKDIGEDAFRRCTSLIDLTIPNSVTNIGRYALSQCTNLQSLTLPFVGSKRGNTGTADSLFGHIFSSSSSTGLAKAVQYYNGENLLTSYIPQSLKTVSITDETLIGYHAFEGCKNITDVEISQSVAVIDDGAFAGCDGLESIVVLNCGLDLTGAGLGAGVEILQTEHDLVETKAAQDPTCTEDGWTREVICSRCNKVLDASITIHKLGHVEVETKASKAATCTEDGWTHEVTCGRCNDVLEMSLPIAALGHNIGEGVVTKEPTIFDEGVMSYYCTRCGIVLKTEEMPKLVVEWEIDTDGVLTSVNLNGATEIAIPDGVTSIGDMVFSGCNGLTSITIPNSVVSIENGAFYGCSGLRSVIFKGDAPEVWGSYAFYGVAEGCVARVSRAATGFAVGQDGKWHGLKVVYFSPPDWPEVEGDEDAEITWDHANGFVVQPSAQMVNVEVTIKEGMEPEKVTVQVGTGVETVKANGANIKVVKGAHDITEYLEIPAADGEGVTDMTKAEVKKEVAEEALDEDKGAVVRLVDIEAPRIVTSATKPGLRYILREGTQAADLQDGDSKEGDGEPWTPNISVTGGDSAFYTIKVEK